MGAKELEKQDPGQVAQLIAQNAARVAELQARVTELENLLWAARLWPERFTVSLRVDALEEAYDKSEGVTPL